MVTQNRSETPLIDEIYQKLCTAGERAAFYNLNKPEFQIYLTHQQRDQFRKEVLAAKYPVFNVSHSPSGEFCFGQKIIVVDETPYVRLVE